MHKLKELPERIKRAADAVHDFQVVLNDIVTRQREIRILKIKQLSLGLTHAELKRLNP